MNGTCSGAVTYNEALAFCNAVGARLCTTNELATDEARNLGCSLDKTLVWSNNECGSDGMKTAYGSSIVPLNGTCVNTTTTAAYDTRCCADTVVDVMTASPTAAPSDKPVPAPTAAPVLAPTPAPSAAPVSEVVTAAPSTKPVPAPSAAPSAAPVPSITTGAPVSAPTSAPETVDQAATGESQASSADENGAEIEAEDSDDYFSTNTITIASVSLVGVIALGLCVGGGLAYKAKQRREATGQPDGNNDVEMAGM